MIVDIISINKRTVSEHGNSLIVDCYPIIDSPFWFGGCVDMTRTVRLLYPDNEQNLQFLRKAKNNSEEHFEFCESAFEEEFISLGQCFVHKSFFETKIICFNEGNSVDLGLSVLWADRNVGASSPSGYGLLYGYGDVTGQKTTDNESAYPHKDIVNTENDIAKAVWGVDWRMPTSQELEELCKQCRWKEHNKDGINGCEVTGPSGNSIFLPFAGCRIGLDTFRQGQVGEIWAGDLSNFGSAIEMLFYGFNCYLNYGASSSQGNSVRPVKDKK